MFNNTNHYLNGNKINKLIKLDFFQIKIIKIIFLKLKKQKSNKIKYKLKKY